MAAVLTTDLTSVEHAERMNTDQLLSNEGVASIGDAIGTDGIFICHRCSAGPGMSGGGATKLQDTGLLLGIHFSSAGSGFTPHS